MNRSDAINAVAVVIALGSLVTSVCYGRAQTLAAEQQIREAQEQLKEQREQQKKQQLADLETVINGARAVVMKDRSTLAHSDSRPAGEQLTKLQNALASLNYVIRVDGTRAEAYNLRGQLRRRLGDVDGAIADFRLAAQHWTGTPDRARALNNIGDMHLERCEFAEAERLLRAAIAMRPDWFLPRANLAELLRRQRKYGPAGAEALRALKLEPEFVGAHLVLGRIYMSQERLGEGVAVLERAVLLDTEYQMDTHFELSQAYFRIGQQQRALKEAQVAVRVDPFSADARRWLAACLRAADQAEEAEDEERRANALDGGKIHRQRC